ncbi:MAG: hypothetical protein HOP22_02805 [Nitrospiraceae bacterium]|jgi:methyl-accepting chemotaxis protein|nr:hypothetical protein [Nitrospiraceae bacterium]
MLAINAIVEATGAEAYSNSFAVVVTEIRDFAQQPVSAGKGT